MYHGSATVDKCTLFSDSVLINRRNVGSDVRSRVSSCKHFVLMEVECRVITAAMEELHIQDIYDIPDDDNMPSNLTTMKERELLDKLAI